MGFVPFTRGTHLFFQKATYASSGLLPVCFPSFQPGSKAHLRGRPWGSALLARLLVALCGGPQALHALRFFPFFFSSSAKGAPSRKHGKPIQNPKFAESRRSGPLWRQTIGQVLFSGQMALRDPTKEPIQTLRFQSQTQFPSLDPEIKGDHLKGTLNKQ